MKKKNNGCPRESLKTQRFSDENVQQGSGGETRQQSRGGDTLTTQLGVPIGDNQNSLKVGARGPVSLEDFQLREKIFHFDHERIPERVVHARGYGAHGYFENYECLSDITQADLFQRPGEQTPAFVRFSTVAGSMGSPDLARDARGFAVKLYTQEGNWDIVGNNIPVFFIQDAKKFPDLIHAAKPEPDRGFPQAQTAHDNFWDFISLMPESMHMIMWAMSDRGIPRSFRFMEGFGVHTFKLLNSDGEEKFVKFHWKPVLGLQSVVWNEALKINGADPDFHRRDLWDSIESGDFPEWELGLQVFDQKFADSFEFDILDATKLIPEELVPVRKVGKLVLNRRVDNFFSETEQVAFCTQNIVPGIDFTNDPLLQGRNFSYLDTQLKRLGSPNFNKLPINAPKCPMRMFQQDGHMATSNPKGRVNYEPNSWTTDEPNPRESVAEGFHSSPAVEGGPKVRSRSETFGDHYSQALQFYNSQTDVEKDHIKEALIFELSKVETEKIRVRMISHLLNIDDDLAKSVADGLGIKDIPEPADSLRKTNRKLPQSDALSILKNNPSTIKGRKFGVFVTDGVDEDHLGKLKALAQEAGAKVKIIAPQIGGVLSAQGNHIDADEKIDGGPSVLFDFIALLPAADKIIELLKNGPLRDFISDAYVHHKFLGYNSASEELVVTICPVDESDKGLHLLEDNESISRFVSSCEELRYWRS